MIPRSVSAPSREFVFGIRDTVPLMIGAIPFGILFGVVALTAHLPWWATQAMSVFVFAGSAQFIAAGMLTAGVAYPVIVLTTFIVNLRHALYSASVAEYVRGLPHAWRAFLAFAMTDESYVVAILHYRDSARDGLVSLKHWYFLGANLGLFVPWQIATAVGFTLGNALGDPLALGLDFVFPIACVAMLIPQLKSRIDLTSALVAAVAVIVMLGLPSKLGLLLAIAAGIFVGVGLEEWTSRS